jgi:hypothetical protein
MHGVGLAVEFDVQNARGGVRPEVGAGVDEPADEAAGVLGTLHGFPGQFHQRGLGPVGDQLDGVDEKFPAAAQLGEALVLGQFPEGDVFGRPVMERTMLSWARQAGLTSRVVSGSGQVPYSTKRSNLNYSSKLSFG